VAFDLVAVGKTFQQCRQQIENLPGCKIEIGNSPARRGQKSFAKNSELAELKAKLAQANVKI
jgi:hypothetical protein